MRTIRESTTAYEAWMATRIPVVGADLDFKHKTMAMDVFRFLRGTFYRWQELWPSICRSASRAPSVVAVGDLHVENFGTWRDAEGRLVWGINDFDEAWKLPYTNDLTRLATSAHLAIEAAHLRLRATDACQIILAGYEDCLKSGGRPFVLEEHHHGLRHMALSELRDPVGFWQKLREGRRVTGRLLRGARKALEALLPDPDLEYEVRRRVAGVGSLGRPRYVALADRHGGIAREAKAFLPSACAWAIDSDRSYYAEIIESAVRERDPFVALRRRWVVRRLAPDCSRIDLEVLPRIRDERRLLHAMGWETANAHLGSTRAQRILKDLRRRGDRWLDTDARAMVDAARRDWRDWRHHEGIRKTPSR